MFVRKKKILALCLAMIFSALPMMNGTLAYFTDTDSAVNVMSMGSVKVVQLEQQRKLDAEGALVGLEEFRQDKILQPTVAPAAYKTYAPDLDEAYWFGANAAGISLPNPIDKIVTVRNDGNVNAYVRTVFAFEAPAGFNLTVDGTKAGWNILYNGVTAGETASTAADGEWTWTFFDADARFVMPDDGKNYVIAVATSPKPLGAGESTVPSLLQYYLNAGTTQQNLVEMEGSVTIYAFTQAVQADGFASADAAFKESFGEITYDSVTGFSNLPWKQPPAQP